MLNIYSQVCTRLAASGKVVLAIEHRDGTAHACAPRSWDHNDKSAHRHVTYLQESDVT